MTRSRYSSGSRFSAGAGNARSREADGSFGCLRGRPAPGRAPPLPLPGRNPPRDMGSSSPRFRRLVEIRRKSIRAGTIPYVCTLRCPTRSLPGKKTPYGEVAGGGGWVGGSGWQSLATSQQPARTELGQVAGADVLENLPAFGTEPRGVPAMPAIHRRRLGSRSSPCRETIGADAVRSLLSVHFRSCVD